MDEKLNEKYLNMMKQWEFNEYDKEESHIKADYILCKLLKELGYTELVNTYNNVPKWYS